MTYTTNDNSHTAVVQPSFVERFVPPEQLDSSVYDNVEEHIWLEQIYPTRQRQGNGRTSIFDGTIGRKILGLTPYAPNKPDTEQKDNYYITKEFKAIECDTFIRNPDEPQEICKCGRPLEKHRFDVKKQSDTSKSWNVRTCTKEMPTNAYGHINFTKVEADFLPKYIRFKYDTDVTKISELVRLKWDLPKPYLIMVVIGGLGGMIRESDDKTDTINRKSYDIEEIEKKKYIDKIKDGLVEAAVSTQAWIVTSGLDNGVSKLVGKAVGTRRTFTQTIPTLGIAAWGTIRENECLVSEDSKGSFPADYTVTEKTRMRGLKGLDINHSAFLLPDFGTYRDYHVKQMCSFKIQLEKKLKSDTSSNLITILVEGGLSSLIEAGQRIKNKIPIVVMYGTGRAADMIGDAKTKLEEYNNDVKSTGFLQSLETAFQNSFNNSYDRDQNYDQAFAAILEIVQNKHLVTIWDPEKSEEGKIDKAILMGLINSLSDAEMVTNEYEYRDEPCNHLESSPSSSSDDDCYNEADEQEITPNEETQKVQYEREFRQLELAIRWNRLDLAEEFLFRNKHYTQNQLNALLGIAMEHKEIDFIKSIISKGASIKRFLTEKQFEIFLNNQANLKRTLLKKLLKKNVCRKHKGEEKPRFIYEHFEKVIYGISQGVYKCPKKYKPSKQKEELLSKRGNLLQQILNCGAGYYAVKKHNMGIFSKPHKGDSNWEPCFEDPENLLVLYFVLVYEHDIAMTLWKFSRTPLILSLICAQICKWLAHQESKMKEITGEHKIQFQKNESEWEDLAIKMVDETAISYNTTWVQALIKHRFYSWGGCSSIEIAEFKKSVKFMSHPGVQTYITSLWMGELSTDTTYPSVLLNIFMIIPWRVVFRKCKKIRRHVASENERKAKQRLEFINQKRGKQKTEDPEALVEKQITPKYICSPFMLLEKFIMFHRAPVTKYFVNLLLYLSFLCVFAMALILDEANARKLLGADATDFNILEFGVLAWMLSSIPLEIRQIYHSRPSTLRAKINCYISNQYNKYDVAALVFLFFAVVVKQGVFLSDMESESYENVPLMFSIIFYKLLLGLVFVLSTTRLLQFLQINSRIGPKIAVISSMMYDLLFFIAIIAIFIIAFGVSTEALIYPAGKNFAVLDLFNFVWRPYIHLFGELNLETLEDQLNQGYCEFKAKYSTNVTCDLDNFVCDDDGTCPYGRLMINIALMIYMMLASALMLNLLIAVFSHTYEDMHNSNDSLWKWQRYDLMMEFKQRSAIPFPFSLLSYFGRFIRWVYRKCLCGGKSYFDRREAQKKNDEYKRSQISLLERECMRNIAKKAASHIDMCKKSDDILVAYLKSLKQDTREGGSMSRDRQGNNRGKNVLGKDFPVPIESEEVDALLAEAEEIPVTFTSPQPLERKLTITDITMDEIRPNTIYPESSVTKYSTTADERDWNCPLPRYNPTPFNVEVKDAEKDVEWNLSGKTASYEGNYRVVKGYPENPLGRTGVYGRGLLSYYGPNFLSIPIITRFAKPAEAASLDTDLDVLVVKSRTKEYRLPEFKARPDEPLTRDIIKLLFEHISQDRLTIAKHNIKRLLKRGILIKRGIVDSPYNTDNAWYEVFIVSYHDDDEEAFRDIRFSEGSKYCWVRVQDGMFADKIHNKYFKRAVYNRRVSQYIGQNVSF